MSVTYEAWKKLEKEHERATKRERCMDYNDVIRGRKSELYEMTCRKRPTAAILDSFDEETREAIMNIHEKPYDEFKDGARRNWQSKDLFRYAGRMALLFVRACVQRVNRVTLKKRYVQDPEGRVTSANRKKGKGVTKSSLGRGMVDALTTSPDARTNKHLKKIAWILRTTKAFRQLFPPEREVECSKHLSYARYEDSRLIAQQNNSPDWFYYVIAGKMILLRQYELSSGVVNKPMGYLTKGMTTDPEEIENQSPREFSLVAKGQVEVLLLHKSVYHVLQSLGDGPPVEYLRTLELFEEFPVELFNEHPDCVEMKYYGEGKVIVKDTNRTPWIHIVKSGLIKVVREQMVLNSVVDIFKQQDDDQLGCVKPDSHAHAMLGVCYAQRQNKLKSLKEQPSRSSPQQLPQLSDKPCLVNGGTPVIEEQEAVQDTLDQEKLPEEEPGATTPGRTGSRSPRVTIINEDVAVENTAGRTEVVRPPTGGQSNVFSDSEDNGDDEPGNSPRKFQLPPLINIPRRESTEVVQERNELRPHRVYLTRERTEASALLDTTVKTEERNAYVELGTLRPSDVFGLEHMQKPMASEPAGFSLLSDGVEVVKISKRFFLQYAQNNTMLKLETLHKQYMSDDEAKLTLYGHQLWTNYKSALLSRISDKILSRNSRKHRKRGQTLIPPRFTGPVSQYREVGRMRHKVPISQSAMF